MAKGHDCGYKLPAGERNSGLGVFGRFFDHWFLQRLDGTTHGFYYHPPFVVGLVINWGKSCTTPVQTIQYLGFTLDLAAGLVQIPTKKVSSIILDLVALQRAEAPTVRKIAAVLGRIRSLFFALPQARLLSDHMVAIISRHSLSRWDIQVILPNEVHAQIHSTIEVLKTWRGRKFIHELPTEILFTDSSDNAWGATRS